MKTIKLLGAIVLIGICFARAKADEPFKDIAYEGGSLVRVSASDAWYLRINPDGSGVIGFGNLPYHSAVFPARTMDWSFLPTRLKVAVKGFEPTIEQSLFHVTLKDNTEESFLLPEDFARSLFEKAFQAATPRFPEEWNELVATKKPVLGTKGKATVNP